MCRLVAGALLTLGAHALFGGVTLDGSFGTSGALPGPNYMIPATVGKQVGSNLFHSFGQFNLISSESATFTGPSNIQNILARVTGGPSSIDGTIRSDITGANLFLLNPAGVMFGPNAQLDVSGSFAVSTASYLKLADGGKFNTSLGGSDVLTSAPVSAFGFLNPSPAGVSVMGSTLNVAAHQCFSVVAGDTAINGGKIVGDGSRVNLISVGSAGEAQLAAADYNSAVDVTQFGTMGDIDMKNASQISTSGLIGGPIVIRGGNVSLDNCLIFSETKGLVQGGTMDISSTGLLKIINRAFFITNTFGSGQGGDVNVHAGSLLIDGLGTPNRVVGIAPRSEGIGDSGNVNIVVDNLLSIYGGGQISSRAFSIGNGGSLNIHAGLLLIDGSANLNIVTPITATSNPGATGSAGDINITVDNLLSIYGRGQIAAQTFSSGDGGNISIHAGSLLIDGSATSHFEFTGIIADSERGATGNAGALTVTVDKLLNIVGGGIISADTLSSGKGGSISIHAGSLSIDSSAGIFAFSGSSATGDAGNLSITVDQALTIFGGGEIFAGTFSSGKGGDISIRAGSLSIDGSGVFDVATGIASVSLGSGDAGRVTIDTTGSIKLNGASSIATSSDLSDAGSVDITLGGTIKLRDHSNITASAGANGGNIHLTAPTLVYLLDSSITATAGTSGSGGTGGNITIDPFFIVLNNSLISANAAAGQGGNINLISNFFLSSNSLVTATGTTNNGTVNITAPELDLGAELITLPDSLVSAANQLQERCTTLLQGDFSSFISIGRGGTEPEPEELQTVF